MKVDKKYELSEVVDLWEDENEEVRVIDIGTALWLVLLGWRDATEHSGTTEEGQTMGWWLKDRNVA
jgi:hypothetical protein